MLPIFDGAPGCFDAAATAADDEVDNGASLPGPWLSVDAPSMAACETNLPFQ
ncbi:MULTISPECIES: hypothetical protein [Burkholderia]|uniref:hypothetical protein n=1 Tax=Burkholderia TaxID=32008 RepID=UPI0015822B31|nr:MULTISPECIES: hypothetical protein [Burkholderia]